MSFRCPGLCVAAAELRLWLARRQMVPRKKGDWRQLGYQLREWTAQDAPGMGHSGCHEWGGDLLMPYQSSRYLAQPLTSRVMSGKLLTLLGLTFPICKMIYTCETKVLTWPRVKNSVSIGPYHVQPTCACDALGLACLQPFSWRSAWSVSQKCTHM